MRKGRVSKPRPDLNLLPIREALPILSHWISSKVPSKLIHPHENIPDADLLALAILRHLHKMPYFSRWWPFLQVEVGLCLPSLTQAHLRLKRLLPVLEGLLCEVEILDFAVIDSEPIPVCRFKRAKYCNSPKQVLVLRPKASFTASNCMPGRCPMDALCALHSAPLTSMI